MRDLTKAGALREAATSTGVALNVLQMDVQDSASVTAALAAVMAAECWIDVLINNAGSGFVRATEQAIEKEALTRMESYCKNRLSSSFCKPDPAFGRCPMWGSATLFASEARRVALVLGIAVSLAAASVRCTP